MDALLKNIRVVGGIVALIGGTVAVGVYEPQGGEQTALVGLVGVCGAGALAAVVAVIAKRFGKGPGTPSA